MAQKQRQVRIEQKSALAAMQALETRTDEELQREQKFKAAALAILGARAAERYDAKAARDYFQRAVSAARPQERMQLRRMADASLALAERRPDDLKIAVERLGQEAPSSRQLFLLRIMGLIAPSQGASLALRLRGYALLVALVVALLAIGFGLAKLVTWGSAGTVASLLLGLVIIVAALGVLAFVGRRRQAKALAARAGRAVCGRYTLASPNPAMLRERFGLGAEIEVRQRFNVAPADDVVCVTTTKEGAPRGDILRWGLVPFWAKDPATGYKMINARAETISERPAFRDALETRRCLIVADGFYEWEKRPGAKQPFWITRADAAPFAFAGLWALWRPPGEDVEPLRTCTIITTAANSALAGIHDRMPVMLADEDAEQAWLAHETPREAALELLAPLASDAVATREVSRAVNDAKYDGPHCLDPPEEPEPTLF
jgi:putative SOS response-associated peptidase YedK